MLLLLERGDGSAVGCRGLRTGRGGLRRRFRGREPLAQPGQAAGEEPGDLHLGHPDGRGDLLLGLVVEEPEVEDAALALRQAVHGARQGEPVHDQVERRVVVADGVRDGPPAGLLAAFRGVERAQPARRLRAQRLGDRLGGQSADVRDLLGRRGPPAQPLLQLAPGVAHPVAGLLHGARQPQQPAPVAQMAFDLAGDGRQRVGEEGVAAAGVVAVHGLDQSQAGDLDQVVRILGGDVAVLGGDPAREGHEQADGLLPRRPARGPGPGRVNPSDEGVDPLGAQTRVLGTGEGHRGGVALLRSRGAGQRCHLGLVLSAGDGTGTAGSPLRLPYAKVAAPPLRRTAESLFPGGRDRLPPASHHAARGEFMRLLLVHPSALMYSEIFLRLEPLGLERVAAAAREAGHEVRVVDLQVLREADLRREVFRFRPDVVGFSLNYLANIPEAIDLARAIKRVLPRSFVFFGGHSVSFVAEEVLEQAGGALDAVVRGEGEPAMAPLLEAVRDGGVEGVPGIVTADGRGPAPSMLHSIDSPRPARDLMRRRGRYFIGELDPCASIEFTRGCPWDCSFCSAWTFYGRSYRKASPEAAAAELASIREPNVFIVDDVAFIRPEHGNAIAAEVERRGVRKQYYLETRSDVLLRNTEVFERWTRLGLRYMFLGMEAIDAEGLDLYRKRVSPDENFQALEVARKLGISVAINLIVDPAWDEEQFRLVREFALSVPEIVHLTVMTPYPGTEIWHTEARRLTTRDYRLFDIQHAVVPTKLPLDVFYRELVRTQGVINRKHLGLRTAFGAARILGRNLAHGQTNFARMLWKFNSVYNPRRQFADHQRTVHYELPLPQRVDVGDRRQLYVHARPAGRGKGAAAKPAGGACAGDAVPTGD
jgi:magnesium-protoporphyrin IX monomethyl ester (oxidative) cyclase